MRKFLVGLCSKSFRKRRLFEKKRHHRDGAGMAWAAMGRVRHVVSSSGWIVAIMPQLFPPSGRPARKYRPDQVT
ncbi:hypothetical protein DY926_12690 [Komagataeibacter melaceti]|uniref:Uncharacterized protein n=1 Tax=Komagataeibacter melaceti TaxID=2766577 RepID=A0A371YY68_9PROT|nr:hypothetical protein DY926_12690 [Komagataeibacter melaceti]